MTFVSFCDLRLNKVAKYFIAVHFQVYLFIFLETKGCETTLKAPRNGSRSIIEQDGTVKYIRFNCDDGYILRGYSMAECRNGRWSSETPVCVSMY